LIIFVNSFVSYSAYASVHQVVFEFKAGSWRIWDLWQSYGWFVCPFETRIE
jgi:hypothetical protein